MKRWVIWLFFGNLLLQGGASQGAEPLRVLFVGNSYTYDAGRYAQHRRRTQVQHFRSDQELWMSRQGYRRNLFRMKATDVCHHRVT